MENKVPPCILTINGVKYDVTKWLPHHPGGEEIMRKYHGLDATAVFGAFHSELAYDKLANFQGVEKVEVQEDQVLKNFNELKKRIESEELGLMKTNPYYYIYKTSSTFGLFVLAVFLLYYKHWFLSAFCLGMFYQQAGWLTHEYCHHQVFSNRKINNFMSYFFGNMMQGFSVTWWKERHNSHHAITNVLEADPDIDNLPIFLWSHHDFERLKSWGNSFSPILFTTLPYQAYYFLPFCVTLRLIWCLQSWRFVETMKSTGSKVYASTATLEKSLLIFHWVSYFSLFFMLESISSMIYFFLISQFVGGFCIAIIVFFNHYACEHIPSHQKDKLNFVELQLRTTRNATPNIFIDWFAGGLNYQIEHHLFPTLPRHNLYKTSHLVKEFCAQNNLPYQCCGFFEGLTILHKHLHTVSKGIPMVAKQYQTEKKKVQ